MPFHKPTKVESVKFDATERRDFVKNFTTKKKKKVDKKQQAQERHKKHKLEQRQERRKANAANTVPDEDLDLHEVQEFNHMKVFAAASEADPFGDVTVTTTTWD